ncbi:MAG: hypothetical protein AB7V26_12640 [Lysobacterales bacterium]
MKLSQYLAVAFGIGVCISACASLSTRPRQTLFLTCEPITHNAHGDIAPVPSPNGRYITYLSSAATNSAEGGLKYLSLDDESESRTILRGKDFHGESSWSPDNKWISYTALDRINKKSRLVADSVYKINVHTGQKIRLVDGRTFPNIGDYTTWTVSNKIVFATPDAIYQVDPDGGTPTKLLSFDIAFTAPPMYLAAAPNGSSIAFSVDTSDNDDATLRQRSGIWLADIKGSRIVQLTFDPQDSFPTWQTAESLMFLRPTPLPEGFSLHVLSLSTGEISPVGHQGILYSIAKSPIQNIIFAATASKWDLSGNDFNFFRGFSISKCHLVSRNSRP